MIRLLNILLFVLFAPTLLAQESTNLRLKYLTRTIYHDSTYAPSNPTEKGRYYHDSTLLYVNHGAVYFNRFGYDTLEYYASDTLDYLIEVNRAAGYVLTNPLDREEIKTQLESRTDTIYASDSTYIINGIECFRFYFPGEYISHEVFAAKNHKTSIQTNVLLLMGFLSWDRAITFRDMLIVRISRHNDLWSNEIYLDNLTASSSEITHPPLPKFEKSKENRRFNRQFKPYVRYTIVEE